MSKRFSSLAGVAKTGGEVEHSQEEINEAPYCTFTLSMDKVRLTSFKFKVWEDKNYLLERQRQHLVHIDDIKLLEQGGRLPSMTHHLSIKERSLSQMDVHHKNPHPIQPVMSEDFPVIEEQKINKVKDGIEKRMIGGVPKKLDSFT